MRGQKKHKSQRWWIGLSGEVLSRHSIEVVHINSKQLLNLAPDLHKPKADKIQCEEEWGM